MVPLELPQVTSNTFSADVGLGSPVAGHRTPISMEDSVSMGSPQALDQTTSTPTIQLRLASPPGSPRVRSRGDTTASSFSGGVATFPSGSSERGGQGFQHASSTGVERSVLGRPAAKMAFLDSLKQVPYSLPCTQSSAVVCLT